MAEQLEQIFTGHQFINIKVKVWLMNIIRSHNQTV